MLSIAIFLTFALLQAQAAPLDTNFEKPEYLRQIEDFSRQCSLTLGIDGPLPQMSAGQFPDNNKDLNKLFGCVWEKLGILNKEAVVDTEKFKEYLVSVSTMFIPEIIGNCKDVEAGDYGEKAIKLQNCLTMNNLKLLRKYYS